MIQFINIIMLNNLFLKNINKTNPLISIKKLKFDIRSWYCNEKILHTYQLLMLTIVVLAKFIIFDVLLYILEKIFY